MGATWLRRVATYDLAESRDERAVKATAIRLELARKPQASAYVDTSHMFIKTFADVVFDEFDHDGISVVCLRRDLLDVAKSFFELDEFGPVRRPWHDFVAPPTARASRFPLAIEEVNSQFDLIFGYLVDTVVRTTEFRQATPRVHWLDAALADISTAEGVALMFGELGLDPPPELDDAVKVRVNSKSIEKSHLLQSVSRELVKDRLDSFLDRFGHRSEVALFTRHYAIPWQADGR